MNLKTRFLGLAAVLIFAAGTASWLAYQTLSQDIIERWGRQVAEIQVRYDSARLLQSLEREIGLAQQMAHSTSLVQWGQSPDDPALTEQAIRQMESFRDNFRDNSYFVALRANGHYYYNNAENEFAGDQLRYVLDPATPDDAWFFQLIEEGRDFHLNVNPDPNLEVTKLWIDVLMRDEQQNIIGMVGTGMNLNRFLQDIVDLGQDGITTLFVDYHGAIQLYRDRNYIDFASIIKPEGQKNTVDLLFDDPQDKQQILDMLQRLKQRTGEDGAVESEFVSVNGHRHLAGIAYLPAIGWFEITLLDLDTLLPRNLLWPLIGAFLAALLITLLLFHHIIQSRILRPVVKLEDAMRRLQEGDFSLPYLPKPDNEIGRLVDHFEKMSLTVRDTTRELEAKVAQRTAALHRQARVDVLTDLENRRGLDDAIHEAIQRSAREKRGFGLLWLDIDDFKAINDSQGHQAGDAILCRVAHWLKAAVRPYDRPGRWGGDEFVVLLSPCDPATLEQVAGRIRDNIERESRRSGMPITVSVGGYFCRPGEPLDALWRQADQALYQAKNSGRNQVCIRSAAEKASQGA